jgi:hypothetical protein
MKTIKTTITTVAFGAFMCAGASAASLEPPGWTAGLALGGALPQGAYLIDTVSIGGWRGIDDEKSSLVINVPVLAWSTPWTIAGGRVEVLAAVPTIAGGVPTLPGASWSGRDYTELYNPAAFVGVAWDLGGGWGFSAFIGGWAPVDNDLKKFGFDSWALSERVNISYVNNGWKFAANLSFGQPGKTDASALSVVNQQVLPDWFNYDLTATKTIGKWEVGLVGFGSSDMNKGIWNGFGEEQSQFALGGLIGYSYPGITLQTYITTDVTTSKYYNLQDGSKSHETRFWSRAIIPVWNPAPLEPSYK